MNLAGFLISLQDTGQIAIDSMDPPALDPASEAQAIQQLLTLDERRRLEMAHEPPPMRTEPALWGATMLYRICQFLVFREIPARVIERDLAVPCPGERNASQVYSVDLTLHRLPELLVRAARIASADPLVRRMQRLAWEWPLSSVGIAVDVPAEGPEPDVAAILSQPSLLQLYVDRILQTKDRSRLYHPAVSAAVRNALGMHGHLAPDFRFSPNEITRPAS